MSSADVMPGGIELVDVTPNNVQLTDRIVQHRTEQAKEANDTMDHNDVTVDSMVHNDVTVDSMVHNDVMAINSLSSVSGSFRDLPVQQNECV